METAQGYTIDRRGTVTAERVSDGEAVELAWGKVEDPEAGDYNGTLGIEDGEWVENQQEDGTTYFIYRRDGEKFRLSKEDLNSPD